MSLRFYLIFLILYLKLSTAHTPSFTNIWVAWNVGQGSWLTHILAEECLHYDIGGESGYFRVLKKSLLTHCGGKINRLNLSHWDYDHFFHITALVKAIPDVCWQTRPALTKPKKNAQKVLELQLPLCGTEKYFSRKWIPSTNRTTNEASVVYSDENVLSPGDSPIQQEKLWINKLPEIEKSRVLILGHHGSRTSTGKELLAHLPEVQFAIASARSEKYGHPHRETLQRLSDFNIPALKTEDWGNIWFQ